MSFRDLSLDLRPLNVLIGPNASGKSNLLEVVALMQALPTHLADFIRTNGGVGNWL
ncbi:MAG: AAA family ATPase [SAR202 cluster bacterium]|nr:AAA family ATPase [SAR202 cluster bacterium]MDP7105012.1 AAA family ATPase [SAR202 cluster bacterium]